MDRILLKKIFDRAVEYGYKKWFSKDKLDLLEIWIRSDKTVLISVLTSKDFADSFMSSFWEERKYIGIDDEEHYPDPTGDWSMFDTFEIFVHFYLQNLIISIYNDELDEFFTKLLNWPIVEDNF